MKCTTCGGGGGTAELLAGNGGVFFRPSMGRTRDTCCPMCAAGWMELAPAAGYYPAGAGILARGANESEAAFNARLEAQARAEEQLRVESARAAADRDAALRGLGGVLGTANTGISEGFATERARLEAESRTAQARAESQATTERARIEAARDVELARLRAQQPGGMSPPVYQPLPNAQLSPLTTPPVEPRTDSGSGQFPVKEAAIVVGLGLALYLATRKGRR
jgi:hypothetical protein